MTVLCGGGTSGPKAGVAATIIFTTGAIASLLNNKGGGWATIAAPLLGVLTYEATELCTTDPPANPTLTPEDYLRLVQLDDLDGVGAALQKLADKVKRAVWFELCECKTAVTPDFPSTTFNPPSTIYVPTDICKTETIFPVAYSGTGQIWGQPASGFPANFTTCRLTVEATDAAGTGPNLTMSVNTCYGLGQGCYEIVPSFAIPKGAGPIVKIIQMPPGSRATWQNNYHELRPSIQRTGGSGGGTTLSGKFEWICDNFQANLSQGCCPPDASLGAKLDQLLELLNTVQRQGVPFAYVPGLDYTGLTGSGEITFSDPILRAQVQLTTLPDHYGVAEGNPDRLFDIGFLSLGFADGFEPPRRITHTPFMLPASGDHRKIGYSFGPGIVATIRTFSREP